MRSFALALVTLTILSSGSRLRHLSDSTEVKGNAGGIGAAKMRVNERRGGVEEGFNPYKQGESLKDIPSWGPVQNTNTKLRKMDSRAAIDSIGTDSSYSSVPGESFPFPGHETEKFSNKNFIYDPATPMQKFIRSLLNDKEEVVLKKLNAIEFGESLEFTRFKAKINDPQVNNQKQPIGTLCSIARARDPHNSPILAKLIEMGGNPTPSPADAAGTPLFNKSKRESLKRQVDGSAAKQRRSSVSLTNGLTAPRHYEDGSFFHQIDSAEAIASRDERNALRKELGDDSIQGPAARFSTPSTGPESKRVTGIVDNGVDENVISEEVYDNDVPYDSIGSFAPQCKFQVHNGVVAGVIAEFESRMRNEMSARGPATTSLTPIDFVTLAFLEGEIDTAKYVFCKYKTQIQNKIDADQVDPSSNGLVNVGTLHEIAVSRESPDLIAMVDAIRSRTKFAKKPHPVTGSCQALTKKSKKRVSRVSDIAQNYKGPGGVYEEIKKVK